ncbi:MAG: transcriptional repressor [Patescibacteria group bacterium]|nr:transcriptional repressor [Patescibacteria group bacterium]
MANCLDQLKRDGAKMTKTRRLLVELFERCRLPLSETEIRQALAARGRPVNKTTVYRELAALIARGLVQQVDFGDRKLRFELAGHHHHLVCTGCRKVQDIHVRHDTGRIERLAKAQKHFIIRRHSLEFFGLCQACAKDA